MAEKKPKRIVVIGGSAAGPKAAARARRLDQAADITIVQKDVDLSMASWGYPYYVGGFFDDRRQLTCTPTGVVRDPQFFMKTKGIRALTGTEAVSIDRKVRTVSCRNLVSGETTTVPYDRLILATGARPKMPPISGVDLAGVVTLHSIADADALRKIRDEKLVTHAVVVGGGLIGIETCEALQLAKLLEGHVRSKAADVITDVSVTAFLGRGGKLEAVKLSNGAELPCELAVIAIGVRPNSTLAKAAGLQIGALGVDSRPHPGRAVGHAVRPAGRGGVPGIRGVLVRQWVHAGGGRGMAGAVGPARSPSPVDCAMKVKPVSSKLMKVQVLERAFDILELLSREQQGLGLTDIGQRLDLHKSTVHRLLQSLRDRGYIEKMTEGNYRLGMEFIELSSLHLNNLELKTEAQPLLRELAAEVNNTVFLAMLQDDEVVYIDKMETHNSLRKYSIIGRRAPLHCTALGKAMLTGRSDTEIRDTCGHHPPKRYTPKTCTDIDRLVAEIGRTRTRGWSVDDEEYEKGIRCIGAPIRDYRNEVIGAVSTSGSVSMIQKDRVKEIGGIVRKAALEISRRMGCRGG